MIANWLLTAVVKIVTTYTQPGQRVLLLTPAPFADPPTTRASAGVRTPTVPDPYAGLVEAGWTVVRLGRGIQTQTAGPPPDKIDSDPPSDAVGRVSQSGPRPHPAAPDPTDHPGPAPDDRRPDPDRAATAPGPDRFELIITAVEPRTLHGLQATDWADLLTPTGTFAVITHSDYMLGRLGDPAGPLVTAADHAGLRYHDRIALLRIPIRNGVLAGGPTGSHLPSRPPHGPMKPAVRHTQAHDDLLVFTRHAHSNTAADAGESSDA